MEGRTEKERERNKKYHPCAMIAIEVICKGVEMRGKRELGRGNRTLVKGWMLEPCLTKTQPSRTF